MRTTLIAIALGLALCSTAAAAEAPTAELFGGYSYLRDEGESFHGWHASLAYNLWSNLGLVAELAGHNGSSLGVDLNTLFFLGGARFSLRMASSSVFVHGLAGGVRARGSITVFGASISESDTNLCYGPGGGLDFKLRDHWALRLQGDYLFIKTEGETVKDPRVSAGVVYRIGGR
jgi:opacity protein-like surface antigen